MIETTAPAAAELYLGLLKQVLTGSLFERRYHRFEFAKGDIRRRLFAPLQRALSARQLELVKLASADQRSQGRDWPADGESMIGAKRMDNLQQCIADVIRRGVPGDFIETGVWRGGAVIFMRAALAAYEDPSRCVWVADSFAGLPPPEPGVAADQGDIFHGYRTLAVSIE